MCIRLSQSLSCQSLFSVGRTIRHVQCVSGSCVRVGSLELLHGGVRAAIGGVAIPPHILFSLFCINRKEKALKKLHISSAILLCFFHFLVLRSSECAGPRRRRLVRALLPQGFQHSLYIEIFINFLKKKSF
jgi:hypothetical protein